MVVETKLIALEKAVDNTLNQLTIKRSKSYLKEFKDKSWYDVALQYLVEFDLVVYEILDAQKQAYINILTSNIKKKKQYKVWEYLDSLFNHVVVDDIKDSLVEMENKFTKVLADSYEKYITKGFLRDSAELVYRDLNMTFDFNKFDVATRDYLRDKKIHWAKEVSATTEKEVKKILVDSFEKGLGNYDIAERIRQSKGFSKHRSETIARTELSWASSYADYTACMQNDNIIGNEWRTTIDRRERATHRAAHTQKRKKGEPFNVGGYEMLFPLDRSLGAPAKEIVKCRCRTEPIYEGESLKSNTIYDASDVHSNGWLGRQTKEFQESYLGGKNKRILFEKGWLDVRNKDIPYKDISETIKTVREKRKEIKPEILTYDDIKDISSLSESTINRVLKYASALWVYSEVNNMEKNITLSSDTGKKICNDVYGIFGKIKEDSENCGEWLEYLNKAEYRSIISMHSHNIISDISIEDLRFFIEYESVKTMFVVDKAGNLYCIEKEDGVKYRLVVHVSPREGSIKVPLDTDIKIIYNTDIAIANVELIQLFDISRKNPEKVEIDATVDGNKLIVKPRENLTRNKVYKVVISIGAIARADDMTNITVRGEVSTFTTTNKQSNPVTAAYGVAGTLNDLPNDAEDLPDDSDDLPDSTEETDSFLLD